MANQEQIELVVNTKGALSALKELNAGITSSEKGIEGANSKLQQSYDQLEKYLVSSIDKQVRAQNRHIEALEKTAAAYGRSPIEKLNAQRELEIQKITRSTTALGQQEVAIKRVNAAYDQMIKHQSGGGGGGMSGLGDMLKNSMSNPIQGVQSLISGLSDMLGPMGKIVTIGTGAIATLFAFAVETGKLGEELQNMSDRTGIGVERLDQLRIMGKIAGVEIDSLTKAAGQLAAALESGGAKAAATRDHLAHYGIAITDTNGILKDSGTLTNDVLEQLSHIPNVTERINAAYELLGRKSAAALLPMISNLTQLQEMVEKFGLGMSKDAVATAAAFDDKLDLVNLQLEKLKHNLAVPFIFMVEEVIKAVGDPAGQDEALKKLRRDEPGHVGAASNRKTHGNLLFTQAQQDDRAAGTMDNFGKKQLLDAILKSVGPGVKDKDYWENQLQDEKLKRDVANSAVHSTLTGDSLDPNGNLRKGRLRLEKEEMLAASTAAIKNAEDQIKALAKVDSVTDSLKLKRDKALEGEFFGLQKINKEYEDQIKHLKEIHQFSGTNVELLKQIQAADSATFNKAQANSRSDLMLGTNRSMTGIRTRGDEALFAGSQRGTENDEAAIERQYQHSLGLAQEAFMVEQDHIKQLRRDKAGSGEAEQQQIVAAGKFMEAALQAEYKQKLALQSLDKTRLDDAEKLAKAQYDNTRKFEDQEVSFQQRQNASSSQYSIQLRKALGHTTIGNEKANLRADEQDRIDAASQSRGGTEEMLKRQEEDARRTFAKHDQAVQLENELERIKREGRRAEQTEQEQIDAAHRQYTIESINLWNKQYDEIKSKTEGLLHTLFTDPKKFGGQLQSTVRDAALKPIEEKLSSVISSQLNTMLHGGKPAEKMSDLKGIGKNGEGDGLTVWVKNMGPAGTPAMSNSRGGGTFSSPVTMQQLMSLPTRSRGSFPGGFAGIPTFANGGTGFSDNGTSITSGMVGSPDSYSTNNVPSGGGYVPGGDTTFGGGGSGSGGFYGGGGGEGGSGVLGSFASQIMGGGFQKGKGGFQPANMLKNLKKTDWGFGKVTDEEGNTQGAGRHGVAGAAIMAGGMALAQDGLMGKHAGTTLGIFEGAAGGAMIGFEYGGPLGAAIGGVVGAGIGIGEKVAGVESKENEAKRLIKQIYHVDVDASTQAQVVQVAKSKYGGKVSLAVRDPEIRKMLELYAAATGQNMAQSATTPHGGSLSQAGGTLSQDASYRYGKAYSFQSNLPVSGGYQTTQYANSNQPMALSISVNGKGAGDFMTGTVSPEFVNAQWQSAANASKSRVQNSAMTYNPGLIIT